MSRIQDILAKADREGTTRHAQSQSGTLSTSSAVMTPVDGTAALEPAPFVPAAAAAPPSPSRPEPRTAQATLHPALVAAIAPHSSVAEKYRAIRTRLTQREESGPLRTIAVTSPGRSVARRRSARSARLSVPATP